MGEELDALRDDLASLRGEVSKALAEMADE
jgi:hypothetical protein